MKKAILILALIAATISVKAQDKKVKPDTISITIPKEVAVKILEGLNKQVSVVQSVGDKISLNDGNLMQNVDAFFIQAIYKHWPDLIPQNNKQNK